jgi:hypothetical protein
MRPTTLIIPTLPRPPPYRLLQLCPPPTQLLWGCHSPRHMLTTADKYPENANRTDTLPSPLVVLYSHDSHAPRARPRSMENKRRNPFRVTIVDHNSPKVSEDHYSVHETGAHKGPYHREIPSTAHDLDSPLCTPNTSPTFLIGSIRYSLFVIRYSLFVIRYWSHGQ